jgi:hypothetical protein
MLFGENRSQSDFLFSLLNLTPADCGRYRDIYVTKEHIVIHTRNGGGNREYYEDVFENLGNHPQYAYDEDDDFDSTYANIYFQHPAEYTEMLQELAAGTITPHEKWRLLLDALQTN